MKMLMLMIRHPGAKTMRTETYWTKGRILRGHVDVRGVTDVTRHAENTIMDPIGGGAYPSVLARWDLSDERERVRLPLA
jgi:hypothetical protein